jgi:hypothetical protein
MLPLPKLSGSLENRFARLKPKNEAAMAPPGVMPSQPADRLMTLITA